MSRVALISASFVAFLPLPSKAQTSFYSLDISSTPKKLVSFNSIPVNPALVVGNVSDSIVSPASYMDLSRDGRLFVVTNANDSVFAIDSGTGVLLGSVIVDSGAKFSGLAVADTGLIYLTQETPQGIKFWRVNFDQAQSTNFMTFNGGDVDGLDFDDQGILIGQDINRSGNIYKIPLDGSPPILITTVPESETPYMTFSEQDNAFYFKETFPINEGRGLYKLPWANGQPAGPLQYVKDIGPGTYDGVAAIPPPNFTSLLQDNFEDGDLTQDPTWTGDISTNFNVVTDPTNPGNLVCEAHGNDNPSDLFTIQANSAPMASLADVALEFDYMISSVADGDTFHIFTPITNRIDSTVQPGFHNSTTALQTTISGGTEEAQIKGPALTPLAWYHVILHVDGATNVVSLKITEKATGNVAKQLSYQSDVPVASASPFDTLRLRVGASELQYFDNVVIRIKKLVRSDIDEDGDIDVNDFLTFSSCFNGSLNPPGCP